MAKAKKAARKPSRSAEVMSRVESFLDMIAPDVVKRLTDAEMRASHAESQLALLQSRLVSLLSADQIEAARVCGITPELYTIEYILLWKERMFKDIPVGIVPLNQLARRRV